MNVEISKPFREMRKIESLESVFIDEYPVQRFYICLKKEFIVIDIFYRYEPRNVSTKEEGELPKCEIDPPEQCRWNESIHYAITVIPLNWILMNDEYQKRVKIYRTQFAFSETKLNISFLKMNQLLRLSSKLFIKLGWILSVHGGR